jgi:hypothetical protein
MTDVLEENRDKLRAAALNDRRARRDTSTPQGDVMTDVLEEIRLLLKMPAWANGLPPEVTRLLGLAAEELERGRADRDKLRAAALAVKGALEAVRNAVDGIKGLLPEPDQEARIR